ncbi:MAG: Ig-like domain-containing protein [Clostridiales bacterium]|jgi:hypothetical protein|nr:Ig-like domain-containing protein [Clostridiales bacterium]
MAISTVRISINGNWYSLAKNQTTGAYEAQITAPSVSSYNQPNHVYACTAEATNTAGTTATADTSDPTVGDDLKLQVKETIAPVITLTAPGNGAYLDNSTPTITANLVDEANGSGIDISTLDLAIDSTHYDSESAGMTITAITNGYSVSLVPQTAISDGSHTFTVNVSDNDGNEATEKSRTFTIDTTDPEINVTTPGDGDITAESGCTISGYTNDATSTSVTVTATLNEVDVGSITVDESGNFSKQVTLEEGENVIVVTATDLVGRVSAETINVTLDTSVPAFSSVTLSPNPVDSGQTLNISVVVS